MTRGRLVWANLMRHKWRTLLTTASVAVAMFLAPLLEGKHAKQPTRRASAPKDAAPAKKAAKKSAAAKRVARG